MVTRITNTLKNTKVRFATHPKELKTTCRTIHYFRPSKVFYTEYYSSSKNNSSAECQQQMSATPATISNSHPEADRLFYKNPITSTSVIHRQRQPLKNQTQTMYLIPTGMFISSTNTNYVFTKSSINTTTK